MFMEVKEILWASLPSIKAKVYSVEDGNKMVSWKVVRQFGDVTVVSQVSPGPKALDIIDILLQPVPPYKVPKS